MNVTYKVRIDEENNGEVFWDHIHTAAVRDGNLLAGRLRDLQFGDGDVITLTDSDLEWVTSCRGGLAARSTHPTRCSWNPVSDTIP